MKKPNYSITHFGLTVSSLEDSIEFYSQNFDFQKIEIKDKPHLKIRLAYIELAGSKLELIEPYDKGLNKNKKQKTYSIEDLLKINTTHLAISSSDLKSTYQQLLNNNVKIITEFNDKFFFCKDLDGHLIEVSQKK